MDFNQSGSTNKPSSTNDTSGRQSRNTTASKQTDAATTGFSAVSAPSISLPKGGGALRGMEEKFNADLISGTGSLTVPIPTTPGRSGVSPQLSLSYDSGGANGPFGMGWHLSLPSITRKTDKGLPKYDDTEESDVFVLSSAEDLVPVLEADGNRYRDSSSVSGYTIHRYRPRLEGLFSRLERWTRDDGDVHWRSISKGNMLTIYGKDENSRIHHPSYPSHIFSWLICEMRDDKGNAIVYEYKAEDGVNVDLGYANERNRGEMNDTHRKANRYPKRILYGSRVPLLDSAAQRPRLLDTSSIQNAGWLFELVIDYGEHDLLDPKPNDSGTWLCRRDAFSSYKAGFEVRTYRLCQRILMFHHFPDEQGVGQDCLVRSLDLTYRKSNGGNGNLNNGDPVASFVASIVQNSYKRVSSGGYNKVSLPPLEFEYSEAVIQSDVRDVDDESLQNLPVGLDDSTYKWVDLDGEGISGILTNQSHSWMYKQNLSPNNQLQEGDQQYTAARLGLLEILPGAPNANLSDGQTQFMDVTGDSVMDIVETRGSVRGFYRRTHHATWDSFRAFKSWPAVDFDDSSVKFVDLTGDGFADLLLTEDQAIVWHESLGVDGFGSATRLDLLSDEERSPQLLFNNGTESVSLSDMSGDGLQDIVRVRNGEICYWPNLGYGQFGAKVTMDNAPWFDYADNFDPHRIRLADIDGSGTTDIIYLAGGKVDIYLNQAGNSWSTNQPLQSFPPVDNFSSVQAIDLLGNGTACLVWSSPLPGNARQPMKYIDLMGGVKPHLLTKSTNNIGAETRIHYTPSTKFYLDDKLEGRPWVTKLPFVVQVVDRVETLDFVSRNHFITRYGYHHGYYDGIEREFRGFGLVEQWDTESFEALNPDATNIDKSSHLPPVLTRTWFHTGAYFARDRISKHFEHEYYSEDGLTPTKMGTSTQIDLMLLPDTVLPTVLDNHDGTQTAYNPTSEEIQEACRSLKGLILRREVYALDETDEAGRPYTASERNYTIKFLQPQGPNRHAVFYTHPREQIDVNYERKVVEVNGRKMVDPRVNHSITLGVDSFGNMLRSVAISYPRRPLQAGVEPEQNQTHIIFTVNSFANRAEEPDWYHVSLSVDSQVYEIVKPPDPGITNSRVDPFSYQSMIEFTQTLFPLHLAKPDNSMTWPYENWDWRRNSVQAPQSSRLRLVQHVLTLYRRDDLTGPYPVGEVGSLALPYESYELAFTPDLATSVFVGSGKAASGDLTQLLTNGRYVHVDGDANWWIPSGRIFFSSEDTDTPEQELAFARRHFFMQHRYCNPFHTAERNSQVVTTYDKYDLLLIGTRDSLGNLTTVGKRSISGNVDPNRPGNDYRLLQPRLMTDSNLNSTEVMFDTLGLVIGTAVKGKDDNVGDSLDGVDPDITQAELDAFLSASDPHVPAQGLLKGASTRILYDHGRFLRTQQAYPDDSTKWMPVYSVALAREAHLSDPAPQGDLKIQISFSYSDGFGREIQKKIQAEPGPIATGGPTISPRWVGSGWTIYNNKGSPVRNYEPFFTRSHDFEFGAKVGVSQFLFYDPVERVIATLHPNHTYEKVLFDPWQQAAYDVNDTVLVADPKTDTDIGDYFRPLPQGDYAPTWYSQRQGGALGVQEQQAARKAAVHADTPTVIHLDSIGRSFLTVAHNKFLYSNNTRNSLPSEEFYRTRTIFDIEGNQRELIDAKNRVVSRYDYDMLGNIVHIASMESGERWMLNDVGGKSYYLWDSRNDQFRNVYDQLQRPLEIYCRIGSGPELQTGRNVYGESEANPELNNLRGKLTRVFDQAGCITRGDYDFKGNLLSEQRQLAIVYKEILDWSTTTPLETSSYINHTAYDALNRPLQTTLPDGTIMYSFYNGAGLVERIEASLSGASPMTVFIANIDYDAKGQRQLIEYGNGVQTTFEYDSLTFRLAHLATRRDDTQFQDLYYTYDPSGNITNIRDKSQQTLYFRNQRVEPSSDYTYSAIYQLIEANSREHLGQTSGRPNQPTAPAPNDRGNARLDQPSDGNAMGRFFETYTYDAVGNILSIQHAGTDPSQPGWTRNYVYNEASQLEANKTNNRLTLTSSGTTSENYRYDGSAGLHGNMTSMPHLSLISWNYKDQLQSTSKQVVSNGGTPETTWYVYDATGRRIRKVTERQSAPEATPTRLRERIYLGGFEIYRTYGSDGNTIVKERQTVHIRDNAQHIALVETRTQGTDNGPAQLIRYQLSNHLTSVALELDDQARVVSYEEYTPFGATSYQAVRSQTEAPKRYRYTGKEHDEESGFSYHGARYYAPWIARWTACDPTGIKDGINLYAYVRNNPIQFHDPSGTKKKKAPQREPWKPPDINVDDVKSGKTKTIEYQGRTVDVDYIPGSSNKTILIVGGIHQDEKMGKEVTKQLLAELKEMQARGEKPYFNVVFVKDLFGDRRTVSRSIEGWDANRSLPAQGTTLAGSVKNNKARSSVGRPLQAEWAVAIALAESFHIDRALQIHDHKGAPDGKVIYKGSPSVTVDPKAGNEAEAAFITAQAALTARKAGVSEQGLRGNFITPDMAKKTKDSKKFNYKVPQEWKDVGTLRTSYPNATATKSDEGVTFGMWASGIADTYLVEAVHMKPTDPKYSQVQGNAIQWTNPIISVLLEDPQKVHQNAIPYELMSPF